MIVQDIIKILDELAPMGLAEDWDNCGLQIGNRYKEVHGILLALDITPNVIEEAVKNKIDMIITHHPLFFNSINSIVTDSYTGGILKDVLKHDISVYSAHTNLDLVTNGVSDALAHILDLKNIKVLKPLVNKRLYKLVVFVPVDYSNAVRKAMTDQGAGWIGHYSHCTHTIEGIGTFLPKENTNPYIGEYGKLEEVKEMRIETIVQEYDINKVIKEMKKAHPYEEVAYDIYPLENKGLEYGYGRIGDLEVAWDLRCLMHLVKDKLKSNHVRVFGSTDKLVKKVAVCGGSGAEFIMDAVDRGADVFITGDIKYHEAQMAQQYNIIIADANHYHTEAIVLPYIKDYLEQHIEKEVQVKISEDNSAPFTVF